jgi:hypothetical protein
MASYISPKDESGFCECSITFQTQSTIHVSVRATCASKAPYHDEMKTPAVIMKCVRSTKISFKDHFIIHKSSMAKNSKRSIGHRPNRYFPENNTNPLSRPCNELYDTKPDVTYAVFFLCSTDMRRPRATSDALPALRHKPRVWEI